MAIPASNDMSLTANAQVMVTSVPLGQSTLTKVTASNLDAVDHVISIYRVPPNEQAGQQFLVVSDQVVPATSWIVIPINGHSAVNGATFQAISDADNMVNLAVSYVTTP